MLLYHVFGISQLRNAYFMLNQSWRKRFSNADLITRNQSPDEKINLLNQQLERLGLCQSRFVNQTL